MLRWRGLDDVPTGWGRSVVTVGVFDGVHRGHQKLIGRAVAVAAARDLPSVLVTFDPHPTEVIRPGHHPAQLTTLARRAELVGELGISAFCVLPFTTELARMPANEFAHEVLVERLHAAAVLVGDNFTFGHGAKGDVPLLGQLGRRFGFAVEGLELITDTTDPGNGITYSSTYIRACIDGGDVALAAQALGRPHRLEGVVVRGDRRGHELGFPTANLAPPPFAAVPADGVYACWFVHGKRQLPAAVSVGTNPTFSGRQRTVEAYVLDVNEDFYGHHVALDFVDRLRGMERFDSVDALVEQMHRDVIRTRELLSEPAAD
ncbi:MAG TPA: bifunctional riboflavin kinase/FAD synthetase [Pseudonocardia sp.]|uniref:bifunctional riboflavin kinase/FAD synthetase n=1 Tax=Pseudonocardia sp. TaxID=60912 RepID=UPI002CDA8130|nr:bifunctional riboflavin kinase/FAD synthetase [Pseudonocardia sp.]HTF52137.1 bifunctional riboflavin kinase/FAD synthetase [Pseudonocardia sp.]